MTHTQRAWGRCGTVVFLVLLAGGCEKKKSAGAAQVMDVLAPYGPQATLNDQGEIVELKLEGLRVDDGALDYVKDMPALKTLSLYGSSVTDAGLAKLTSANKLESLGLGKTRVTRRGLTHLERLPALRWLWLNETKSLTAVQIEDFKKKAVPGITVYQ